MLKKLLLAVVFISFIVLVSPVSAITNSTRTSQQESSQECSNTEDSLTSLATGTTPQNISHSFNLHIVFIGYDRNVINTTLMSANIGQQYELQYWDAYLKYAFKIDYKFASQSYLARLKSFILDHSVNGTGLTSKINVTALQYQKETGTHMSIFLPQSGRAIDGTAVEQWFADHPYGCASGSELGYTFYVMNFTEFDSADHTWEHWYNVSRYDVDAKSINDYWRLEWDNSLNPDVKFPYPAFTSKHRLIFIDPSAFQWYLTWARIWWGIDSYLVGPKYDYYYQDLDSFDASHNLHTPDGRNALAQYLAGWVDDLAYNLISPVAWPTTGNTVSLQVLVLNNVSQYGYPNEKMEWILNSTLVHEAVKKLAPYMKVNVIVKFENLSSHPEIEQILNSTFIEEKSGWRYYDGYQLFYDLEAIRDQYFSMKAADMTVNAYVFLVKNASMESGPSGMEFTGLGGMQQILILKSIDRYFRPDGVTPKSGLSMVMIHEFGHNIAFPHTFSFLDYAGDFSQDAMGYYSYFYTYSKLRTDMFRRTVVDMKLLELKTALRIDISTCWPWPKRTLFFKTYLLNAIKSEIDLTMKRYDSMQYLNSYYSITKAERLEAYLREIIMGIRVPGDIDCDGRCGTDDLSALLKSFGSTPSSPRWNPKADLNKDAIVNCADYKILRSFLGQKAKVTVAFFGWKTKARTTTIDVGAFIYPEYDIPYVDANTTYGLQNWGKKPCSCLIRISGMTLSNLFQSLNVTIYNQAKTIAKITWTNTTAMPTNWVKLTLYPSVRYSIKIELHGTAEANYQMTVITLQCKQLHPCTRPY